MNKIQPWMTIAMEHLQQMEEPSQIHSLDYSSIIGEHVTSYEPTYDLKAITTHRITRSAILTLSQDHQIILMQALQTARRDPASSLPNQKYCNTINDAFGPMSNMALHSTALKNSTLSDNRKTIPTPQLLLFYAAKNPKLRNQIIDECFPLLHDALSNFQRAYKQAKQNHTKQQRLLFLTSLKGSK